MPKCMNFFDHLCGCEGFVVLEASINFSLEVIFELSLKTLRQK